MFFNNKVLVLCILILNVQFLLIASESNADDLVEIENGQLKGEYRHNYIAFEGIPYAKPPVGDLRFEPPQPYTDKWDGIRNANRPGEMCMQWDHYKFEEDKLRGTEDCLFINVYTRNIKPEEKYPVIVHIHGGGVTYGNGDFYGPDFLLERPMILVNFNYRLGPLGFLSTEDNVVPGNMGMKDQNMALRWVKENIEKFGGDPERITITGYSAGGASVHLHILSKMSDGLFTNGISHSGCGLTPWINAEHSFEKAKMLGSHVGCFDSKANDLIKCLKNAPAQDIVRSVKHFMPFQFNPFTPFGVVVEPESDNAFLTDTPMSITDKGDFKSVPWLATATEAEGLYAGGELMVDEKYIVELDKDWMEIAPHLLDYNWTMSSDEQRVLSEQARQYYLGERKISVETLSDVIKMMSDRLYLVAIQHAVREHSRQGKPTFFYYFKFRAAYGVENALAQRDDIDLGVAHGDDVHIIYSTPLRIPKHPFNEDEIKMQKKLVGLYEQFARFNGANLKFGDVDFVGAGNEDGQNFNYLEINGPDNMEMKQAKDLANEDFWKKFPYL